MFFTIKKNLSILEKKEKKINGTYTKYSSIDDKINDLHHYTWFIKTGRGRCTEDSALKIRNKIIDREEAKSLVKQYDGEFPKTYFKDILEYLKLSETEFHKLLINLDQIISGRKRITSGN